MCNFRMYVSAARRSRITCFVIGFMLLNMSCNKHSSSRTPSGKAIVQEPLVRVREASPHTNSRYNYFLITVYPSTPKAVLASCILQAEVHPDAGSLLGSSEKSGNRYKYNIPLAKFERKLTRLLPSKGSAGAFATGKSIAFKCRYDPPDGAKRGEKHRLRITVTQPDSRGNNRPYTQEATFLIKKDITASKSAGSTA